MVFRRMCFDGDALEPDVVLKRWGSSPSVSFTAGVASAAGGDQADDVNTVAAASRRPLSLRLLI